MELRCAPRILARLAEDWKALRPPRPAARLEPVTSCSGGIENHGVFGQPAQGNQAITKDGTGRLHTPLASFLGSDVQVAQALLRAQLRAAVGLGVADEDVARAVRVSPCYLRHDLTSRACRPCRARRPPLQADDRGSIDAIHPREQSTPGDGRRRTRFPGP